MATTNFMDSDDFGFDRDFSGLRNKHGLSRTEADYLGSLEDVRMAPHLNLMMKMHSQIRQDRNADLAYEATMFELEEKKREAKEEIDNADKVAQVTMDLNEISNSDKDTFVKQQEIADYGMRNPYILNKSAAAKLVYAAANDSLKAQAAQKASLDKGKEDLMRIAQVGGMTPEQFEEAINADGVVTDSERSMAVFNKTKYDAAQKSLKAGKSQAESEHRKQFRTEQKSALTDELKHLDDISETLKFIQSNTPTSEWAARKEGQPMEEVALSSDAQKAWQTNQIAGITVGGRSLSGLTLTEAFREVLNARGRARREATSNISAMNVGGAGSTVGEGNKPTSKDKVDKDAKEERSKILSETAAAANWETTQEEIHEEIEAIRQKAVRDAENRRRINQ